MQIKYALLALLLMTSSVFAIQLRVVTEDLPPLQIVSNDGALSGAMVDLVQLVLNEADITANVEVFPWARSYQIAKTEANTLIFSMLRSPSRENSFQWVGKLYHVDSYFMGLKSRTDIPTASLAELREFTVGAVRDDLAVQYLIDHQFVPGENLYLDKKYNSLWSQLYQGRTDLVFTNSTIWQYEVKSIGLDPELLEIKYEVEDFSSDLYLAASLKTAPHLVTRLRRALNNIKQDGRYQQILNKWLL